MSGLRRIDDDTRPREAWAIVVLESIERLTTSLRRGHPFSTQAVRDMQALQRRLQAFSEALDYRLETERERENETP